MKWILILVLMIGTAYANDFTKGEGRFVSKDEDAHNFVKQQLIHEGTLNIVKKEIKALGLNSELFFQKYNEKLNDRNLDIEKNLIAKLNITDESKSKEKKNFQKIFRFKKLRYRRTFGRLNTVISKYTIKKISRSQKYPNYRYIRMEASVNTQLLNKIYYKYVSGRKRSDYGSLFLNVNYKLSGITYSELGIENESDFSNVITNNWINWFSKNKPMNIANIERLSDENTKRLEEYQKLTSEVMLANIPEVFVNSLLLDVQVEIVRDNFDKRKSEYTFKYIGAGYLKDLQSNLIVETYKFNGKEKKIKIEKDLNIANIIVNDVYRMALGSFPGIIKSVKNITNINSVQRIVLTDFPNMGKVMKLVDLIQDRGVKYSVKAEIESISKNKTEVVFYFDGKKTDLITLLNKLQSAKKDLKFMLIEESDAISIKFNKEEEQSII